MTTPPKIPRGIQTITRSNADGSKITSYRIQIKRKTYQCDRLFESINEAIEFLNTTRTYTGRNQINLIERQQIEQKRIIDQYFAYETISDLIKHYLDVYIEPKYKDYDKTTALGKHKLRALASTKASYKMITETIVEVKEKEAVPGLEMINPKLFQGKFSKVGDLKPIEFTDDELNLYILERLKKKLKPVSIEREITNISNLYKKMRYLDPTLKKVPNPTLTYDRDLLHINGRTPKPKKFRFNEEERDKFFKIINEYENPQLAQIIKLQLYCSLRRAETILLEWEDIKHNHIIARNTKNGNKDRIVFLTPSAQEYIKTIPHGQNKKEKNRLFSYSVLGFDGSFTKLMQNNGLKITSHKLRKESISSFIENIGSNQSMLIAEFLGISNIKKFEETHIKEAKLQESINSTDERTQEEMLENFGHSKRISSKHYFSLERIDKDPAKKSNE